MRTILTTYWRKAAVAAFAIMVFCFWYFLYPHLMAWREQAQLFLWNGEYLLQRLAVPGGLAQYLGEMLVQFFADAKLGAFIYAVIAVCLQQLTARLISRPRLYWLSFVPPVIACGLALNPHIPMTPIVAVTLTLTIMALCPKKRIPRLAYTTLMIPIGYWLVGPAILLLVFCNNWRWAVPQAILWAACVGVSTFLTPYPFLNISRGIDDYWEDDYMSTDEEMRYDRWMRLGKWSKIADYALRHTPQQGSSHNVAVLAQFKLNHITHDDLQRQMKPTKEVMQSTSGAFIMSDIFMQLGLVNMSQRAAFEAMESIPNHNKSGRALKRLTETAIATGQSELAQKYLSILRETIVLRKWAKDMKTLAANPSAVVKSPFYQKMRDIYSKSEDFFFY